MHEPTRRHWNLIGIGRHLGKDRSPFGHAIPNKRVAPTIACASSGEALSVGRSPANVLVLAIESPLTARNLRLDRNFGVIFAAEIEESARWKETVQLRIRAGAVAI